MHYEFEPTDDTGSAARLRRDEIHELIEFGVPVEAIQAHASAGQPLEGEGPPEARVHELLDSGDGDGSKHLLREVHEDLSWVNVSEEDI